MANLLSSTIGSHFYGSNNQSNILLKTAGSAGDGGILLQNSAGAFKFQIYGTGTDYGFLDGAWADWDIRKTINGKLYLNGTTSYYLQTDAHSYLSTLDVGDASNGVSLNVGNGSAHGVYTLDNARNYLVVAADYYPHMALVASGSNNTTHGAVFSFVGTEGSSARQWNIGIPNQNPFLFSIGYNRSGDNNPHYGIGDGWHSDDNNHARLSIDRDGNTKIRGMLYVNGTSGGISVGNAVIHAGNIASQSVDFANRAEFQTIPDHRGNAYVPNDYAGNRVWWHFNNTAAVGGYGTYWNAIQTVSPWSDYDPSHRQQQIQWGGTDISFRYATSGTTWSSWFRFITDANIGAQSVSYAASAGVVGTADYAATAGDADTVDGYNYSQFTGVLARYITTAGSSARIRITAPFNTNSSKMFSVDINMYAGYTQYKYTVSGYMYGSINQWYDPKAVFTGTGTPDIYVGRDNSGRAYISIANGNYTGIVVNNFVSGYVASEADAYNPWSITLDSGNENSVGVGVVTTITSENIESQSVSYADESGYSSSTGTTDNIGGVEFKNTGSNFGTNADTIDSNGITYYNAGVSNFSGNATDGALYSQRYSTSWQHQIAGDYRSGMIAVRGRNNGTWTSWRTIIDSSTIGSQSVSNAVNLSGLGVIQSTSPGTSYQNNYQVRENSGGNGNTSEVYAPQLAFHWGGVVASSIMMEASGRIAIRNNPGTAYENFIANIVYASSDMRAPIFYDYDNTGYSWNPNTSSAHRFSTPNGYVDIGPMNGSWCHFQTDRPRFYFGNGVTIDGDLKRYSDSALYIHSANYNSYAPTLTGGGASGTWEISVTGSAASAGRSSSLDIVGYGNGNMTYYQSPGTFAGHSSWAGYFVSNHGDGATYYNQTIIMPFWGPPQYSRLEGGTLRGPYSFWSTENMDAPNKSGTSYYQTNTWMQFNGAYGLYWPSNYDAHFHPNDGSSYTQFSLRGQKNGYGGIYDQHSRVNGFMYDGEGNGGVYRESNGLWYFYYHLGNNCMGIGTSSTSSSYKLYVNGTIYATGDVIAYSDSRKKTNIVTIDNALNKVLSMRGVFYNKVDEPQNGRQVGVIAQEVNEVLPEAVNYASDVDEYGVKYGNIVGVLIEAIKEQQGQIDELKAKLDGLTK